MKVGGYAVPPLIRQYLSMNARFIDFHVERTFGDARYCLLRVDLTVHTPRWRLRASHESPMMPLG